MWYGERNTPYSGQTSSYYAKTTKAKWTQDSRGNFGFLKLSQISKKPKNIIVTSLKVMRILKV